MRVYSLEVKVEILPLELRSVPQGNVILFASTLCRKRKEIGSFHTENKVWLDEPNFWRIMNDP